MKVIMTAGLRTKRCQQVWATSPFLSLEGGSRHACPLISYPLSALKKKKKKSRPSFLELTSNSNCWFCIFRKLHINFSVRPWLPTCFMALVWTKRTITVIMSSVDSSSFKDATGERWVRKLRHMSETYGRGNGIVWSANYYYCYYHYYYYHQSICRHGMVLLCHSLLKQKPDIKGFAFKIG